MANDIEQIIEALYLVRRGGYRTLSYDEVNTLLAHLAAQRGAMKADEDRLRKAADSAGVAWMGCDTAEVMSDIIEAQRSALKQCGEALRCVEWIAVDELDFCPACGTEKGDAHAKGCAIGVALALPAVVAAMKGTSGD